MADVADLLVVPNQSISCPFLTNQSVGRLQPTNWTWTSTGHGHWRKACPDWGLPNVHYRTFRTLGGLVAVWLRLEVSNASLVAFWVAIAVAWLRSGCVWDPATLEETKRSNLMDELEQAQLRIKELEGELALVRKASAQESKDLTARLKQLEQSWAEEQQRSLRAEALSELRQPEYKIVSPEQFWKLFGADSVQRDLDGGLYVEDQGIRRSVKDWVQRLSLEPDNAHHFRQEGSIMDRVKSAFAASPQNNPWKRETWNLTEQGRVFQRDLGLAERLRREAGR